MDNLGRSLNRTLIGNSQVVKGNNEEGNLSVEGDLIVQGDVAFDNVIMNDLKVINSLSVDGYTLPESAGTDGQVLTMNADGKTTDFKDITAGTARVVVNKYTGINTRNRNQAENGLIVSIESSGVGSKIYNDTEFSEGSVIVIRAYGSWTYLRSSQTFIPEGSFWLLFGTPPNGPLLIELFKPFPNKPFGGTFPVTKGAVGNWELNIQITRINATQVRIGATMQNSLQVSEFEVELNIVFPEQGVAIPDIFNIPGFPLDCAVKWQDNSSQGGGTAYLYPTLCGYTQDLINAGTNILATSQTLSTNHLLLSNLNANGPSGYADSGHNLMLLSDGSKPLTGTINMNGNNIVNCASLSNDGGTELLDFSSNNALLKTDGQLAGIQETNTLNNIAVSPNISGITALLGEIQIRNLSSTGTIYTYTQGGDILTETKGGTPSDIKITSNKDIFLNSKIMNITPINELKITTPITTHNGIFNMFDNNIVQCKEINHSFNDIRIKSNVSNVIIETGLINGSSVDNIVCNYNNTTINNNLSVNTINNLTAVGGVSASTGNSALIQNTTATISLLSASFVGNRSVPPNTFQIGDAYSAVLAGTFDATNGTNLTITLNAGAVGTSPISQIVVPLSNASASFFELEINFCIKTLGVAGEMAVNYDFSYNGGGGNAFQGERKCENVNLNTTILNTLDITASFSIASVNNAIQSLYGTLTKIY